MAPIMFSWKQVVATAVLLGVVAAGVVWYLERFEVARMHEEMRGYLERHDAFQSFLKERPAND